MSSKSFALKVSSCYYDEKQKIICFMFDDTITYKHFSSNLYLAMNFDNCEIKRDMLYISFQEGKQEIRKDEEVILVQILSDQMITYISWKYKENYILKILDYFKNRSTKHK